MVWTKNGSKNKERTQKVNENREIDITRIKSEVQKQPKKRGEGFVQKEKFRDEVKAKWVSDTDFRVPTSSTLL